MQRQLLKSSLPVAVISGLLLISTHAIAATSSATISLSLAEQQHIAIADSEMSFPATLTIADLVAGGQESTSSNFVAWTTDPEPTQGLRIDINASSYELVNQTNSTYKIPLELVFTPCGAGAAPITAKSGDASITIPKENISESVCKSASGGQEGSFKVILLPYTGGGNLGLGDYKATVQLDLAST